MKSINQWRRQLRESAWLLGICEDGYDDLKAGRIHWIDNGKYKKKKWFADPFILEYDNEKITLLVEEFDYKEHRGRIARLYVDRKKWTVTDCKIILDIDTHLSFPMIWREHGEIYVCPENYKSGGWSMYRYDADAESLTFVKKIIDEKLTDATIWKDGDDYWLISTYDPNPNGKELTLWKSVALGGPYKKIQKVCFAENTARNAGMIIKCGCKLIRPAQESNITYGHSIVFQEVKKENDKLAFCEIFRFQTPHKIFDAGAHTFNQHKGGMAVIDVKGYRYRYIAKLLSSFGSLLVNLGLKKPFVIR